MEIDRLEIAAGARMKGVPHVAHTKEYCTCISGKIEIHTGGESFTLSPGDVLAFPGDNPHSYYNPTGKKSVCLSVVVIAF